MGELKVGMYVRGSVDYEDSRNPRLFAIGQVEEIIDDENVCVVFYKNFRKTSEAKLDEDIPEEQIYNIKNLTRCKILKESKIIHYYEAGKIVSYYSSDESGYYEYYIKTDDGSVKKIKESKLMVDFNRGDVSPYDQMINYEFHAPFWYAKRKVASESLHIMNNFGEGFKTLIGARVYLFEHQIDTIIKGLSEKSCRLMLADEVGLGKTIEALIILKGLKKKKEKILLIVPETLVNQWQHELDSKLWMESVIYSGNNIYEKDVVIVPIEKVNMLNIDEIIKVFTYCVVDEVHRMVGENLVYDIIFKICKDIKNVLLLSATPIQNRKEEYLKLLKLLKPDRYEAMTEDSFAELFEKNSNIRKLVYRIYRDLPTAYGEEIDIDEVEEIYESLEDIKYELGDKCLEKMINELDMDSEDKGEEKVREILAYLSMTYQFEKNIIRHRREEMKNILPKRQNDTIFYMMKSGAENYYENNCYEKVIQYIESLKDNNQWTENLGEYIRLILNSMFSSPWALEYVIGERKCVIKNRRTSIRGQASICKSLRKERERMNNTISSINSFYGEEELIGEIKYDLDKWKIAAERELNNIEELMSDPDLINGRLGKVIDYLEEQLYDSKVVIFSSWVETLDRLKVILGRKYGEECVTTFNINDSVDDLEENVFKFQNNSNCRFMLCDELGGEGRNFQMADAIVHIDIPFSPTVLEQRIGRLDRIGRNPDNEVLNVLVISEDTIEMSLYDLWNEGLNIFNESLSGLEIALEDINRDILNALKVDMKYGLYETIGEIKPKLQFMKKSVEEERYYDMARQLDDKTRRNYEKLIDHFDNKGGSVLANMMLDWCIAVGFIPTRIEDDIVEFGEKSIREVSMKKTMFSIPNTSVSLKKSKCPNVIRGTFNRDVAVNKEDLVFFAPGEEIFESIMTNVEEDFKGRSVALKVPYAPFNWEGFIIRWNSNFNKNFLLDNGFDINYSNFANGNIPVDQIEDIIAIDDFNTSIEKVKKYIDEDLISFIYKKRDASHLGKRENGNIDIFKKNNPSRNWRKIIEDSFIISKANINKRYFKNLDKNKIKREFSQILATSRASEKYYSVEENSDDLKKILNAVLQGIQKPEFVIDSILYLKMEKDNV